MTLMAVGAGLLALNDSINFITSIAIPLLVHPFQNDLCSAIVSGQICVHAKRASYHRCTLHAAKQSLSAKWVVMWIIIIDITAMMCECESVHK